MRIAVGGFMHETNTFVDQPTTWDDFVRAGPWPSVSRGAALRADFRGLNLAVAHFMTVAEQAGHEIVPLAWAAAQPAGKVTDDTFEHMTTMLTGGLGGTPVDA